MKLLKYARSFEVVSELPDELSALRHLAQNFRWTWHPESMQLFEDIDPTLWEQVEHNPMQLISRLTDERKASLAKDSVFLAKLDSCSKELDTYMNSKTTWFDETYPGEREKTQIAYFCFEFGINESLPIYSGGLGVLAGDHLKAASDIGLPLVGVGLLYSRGYFRQSLSPEGWQQERYPNYDFFQMPLQLLRDEEGQPISVKIDFPDRTVTCHLWKAQVGRIELILLDSNVLENAPDDQGITDALYGGDEQMRLRQEMILGIGGMRALKALKKMPTACHMNEGHAAFLTIERLNQLMDEEGCDYKTARQTVVSGNIFTTHTPVPAGFDVFRPELLKTYISKEIEELGISFDEFLKLGRFNPGNTEENLNMAVLAMENANYVNGVSKLHAHVSRGMFAGRWPDYPRDEVPIDAITNGIHTATWMSRRMAELFDRHFGKDWRNDVSNPSVWGRVHEIPDSELWDLRENLRGDFIRFLRKRTVKHLKSKSASKHEISAASSALDPRVLTIGFARRFATYKRAYLLMTDKERLHAILNHAERPVQFVFAGKSHPRDDGGKKVIQDIYNFIQHEGGKGRIVFLEDYDMEIARNMIQGVDVWLNNPRRPLEASGTSGMKVIPNGGLNASVLDGWWAEGYQREVGWAIGESKEYADEGYQDWIDSRSLYQVIEQEIVPAFYSRGETGIPAKWLEMVKASMAILTPEFSTTRMVQDYANNFYMPSSGTFRALRENNFERAKNALEWRARVRQSWPSVKIASVTDSTSPSNSVGTDFTITANVELGQLSANDVVVELVVGKASANRELSDVQVLEMQQVDGGAFQTRAKCEFVGEMGYVVRVVPSHPDVRVAHELPLVCWQSGV